MSQAILSNRTTNFVLKRLIPTITKLKYDLFDVNLVAVRNRNRVVNVFNDSLFLFIKDNNNYEIEKYIITTEPGLPFLLKPFNTNGTAIMVPNQYKDMYELGVHKRGKRGAHKALVQVKPCQVYRDNDLDDNYDYNKLSIQQGLFGLNIHRASSMFDITGRIDSFSAGCQVFESKTSFERFIERLERTKLKTFSYTLIDEVQLVNPIK